MKRGKDDSFKTMEKPCSDIPKPVGPVMYEKGIKFDVIKTINMNMAVPGDKPNQYRPVTEYTVFLCCLLS
jgi:hypothetical protein